MNIPPNMQPASVPRRGFLFLALGLGLGLSACAGTNRQHLSALDQQDVDRVEAYLNGLAALNVRFTQVWPDGGQGEGDLSYRPGSLDLDYTNPRGLTLRAGAGKLVVRDERNGSVTRVGLSRNPLGLLLSTPIHFSGQITVTSVQRRGGTLQISLARTAMLSDGLLTIQFLDQGGALSLLGIEIVDDRHHSTVLRIIS